MSDSMQRGLSDKQIAIIQNSQKLMDILRRDDIFFGIRNGYFNLYYHGVSAGKLSFLSKGTLKIETHCKYLGEDTEGYKTVPLDIYLGQFDKILAYIQTHQQSGKGWDEKIAQQNFMMATNRNPNSVWYCVDMEYVPLLHKLHINTNPSGIVLIWSMCSSGRSATSHAMGVLILSCFPEVQTAAVCTTQL